MSKLNQPQKLAAISMLVVAVSAFLPWVSLFGLSVAGTSVDGKYTLLFALVGLVVLAIAAGVPTRASRKVMLVVSGIGAALTASIGVVDMNEASAIGLYLTMFAGFAWVGAVIWDLRRGPVATVSALTPRDTRSTLSEDALMGETRESERGRPLWIWFTLGLSFTGPPAFLYAGVRARKWSWVAAAAIYATPVVLVWEVSDDNGEIEPNWLETPLYWVWFGFWLASIVHAFVSASEYNSRRHGWPADDTTARKRVAAFVLPVLRVMLLAPLKKPGPIPIPMSRPEPTAICIECGRPIGDDGRRYSDGAGELAPYCAACAREVSGRSKG